MANKLIPRLVAPYRQGPHPDDHGHLLPWGQLAMAHLVPLEWGFGWSGSDIGQYTLPPHAAPFFSAWVFLDPGISPGSKIPPALQSGSVGITCTYSVWCCRQAYGTTYCIACWSGCSQGGTLAVSTAPSCYLTPIMLGSVLTQAKRQIPTSKWASYAGLD